MEGFQVFHGLSKMHIKLSMKNQKIPISYSQISTNVPDIWDVVCTVFVTCGHVLTFVEYFWEFVWPSLDVFGVTWGRGAPGVIRGHSRKAVYDVLIR